MEDFDEEMMNEEMMNEAIEEELIEPTIKQEIEVIKQRLVNEDPKKNTPTSSSSSYVAAPKRTKDVIAEEICDVESETVEKYQDAAFRGSRHKTLKACHKDSLEFYLQKIRNNPEAIDLTINKDSIKTKIMADNKVIPTSIDTPVTKVKPVPVKEVVPEPEVVPDPKGIQEVIQEEGIPQIVINNVVLNEGDMLAINGLRNLHYLLAKGGESYCKNNYNDCLFGFAEKRRIISEQQYSTYAQLWLENKKSRMLQTALSPISLLAIADFTIMVECIDQSSKRFLD